MVTGSTRYVRLIFALESFNPGICFEVPGESFSAARLPEIARREIPFPMELVESLQEYLDAHQPQLAALLRHTRPDAGGSTTEVVHVLDQAGPSRAPATYVPPRAAS
jgi:hypothetical protein